MELLPILACVLLATLSAFAYYPFLHPSRAIRLTGLLILARPPWLPP
jgi:hypothetical protein